MTPERWEQVQEWFNRLVNLPLEQKRRELDKLGDDDPELRREVEVQLSSGQGGDFLHQVMSGASSGGRSASKERRDRVGQTISHYRIEERIGGGGMGVVYRAQDLRLDRSVALKFLPPATDDDEERLKRLIVEARAASALDHPNICTIHQIDQTHDGHWFIVMGYYAGETLKARIEGQTLAVAEVLDYAAQMGHGLIKAHKEGIVHRDLKPANLIVTTEGVLKILDFGLAQLVAQTKLTAPGTRLGTPAYMSPEQAQGQPVDHRTDIWSLGVVIYEMLAGRSPFKGDYELAVIYSIVNEEPTALAQARPDAPPELVRLVEKALSKDPNARYQQVDDLLREVEALRGLRTAQTQAPLVSVGPVSAGAVPAAPAETPVAPRSKKRFLYLALAAAAAIVLAVALSLMPRQPAEPAASPSQAVATEAPGIAGEGVAAEEAVTPEPAEAAPEAAGLPPATEPAAAPAAPSAPAAEERQPPRSVAPVRSWPPPSGRWALIIGVEQYADGGITPFRGAAGDAAALSEALVRYAGFPQDQVTLLSSNGAALRAPTRANIETYLQSVTRLVPTDGLLLFCFVGHAATVNGQPVLLPVDARPSRGSIAANSAVPLESVRQAVRRRGIRQAVVLFDGFRQNPRQQNAANSMNQGYARGLSFDPASQPMDAYAGFFAAAPGERAYGDPSEGGGYFSSVLVAGLSGAAADERGRITLGGLERYVREVVPKRVIGDLGARALQRPFAQVGGYVRDEVLIATVARREVSRSEPAPPPAAPPNPAAEELAEWTRLRDSNDIGRFEAFLRDHPNGALRQEAQSRIDDLRWQAARGATDPAVLERYLQQNPNSRYAAQAQARIQELRPPPPPEPAAVTKAAPQPAADPGPSEADGIRDVLRRYGAAYRARDAEQVAALWPTLNAEQLRRIADSFRVAVSIEQDLIPLAEPDIRGNEATVRCRRLIRYEDERGPQRPIDEQVTVALRKQQGAWLIQAVN